MFKGVLVLAVKNISDAKPKKKKLRKKFASIVTGFRKLMSE